MRPSVGPGTSSAVAVPAAPMNMFNHYSYRTPGRRQQVVDARRDSPWREKGLEALLRFDGLHRGRASREEERRRQRRAAPRCTARAGASNRRAARGKNWMNGQFGETAERWAEGWNADGRFPAVRHDKEAWVACGDRDDSTASVRPPMWPTSGWDDIAAATRGSWSADLELGARAILRQLIRICEGWMSRG